MLRQSLRSICTRLRPGVLDDLGLAAAIEWQVKEFASITGIHCDVSVARGLPVGRGSEHGNFPNFAGSAYQRDPPRRGKNGSRIPCAARRNVLLVVQDDGKGIRESDIESLITDIAGIARHERTCGGPAAENCRFGEIQVRDDCGTTNSARRIKTIKGATMLILLADDHVVVRRGLADMLANAFAGAQFVEAGTGDEVVGHIRRQVCDLLILDVTCRGEAAWMS